VSLQPYIDVAYDDICMHECVFSAKKQARGNGVRAGHIAKRIMDYGYHPPTIYFPLIAPEALMIEPTETESKETLDEFILAMRSIMAEAADNPELVKSAPLTTPVRRLDELGARKNPDLRWSCGPVCETA
jgi:glycine dehydrogenase subunit 2